MHEHILKRWFFDTNLDHLVFGQLGQEPRVGPGEGELIGISDTFDIVDIIPLYRIGTISIVLNEYSLAPSSQQGRYRLQFNQPASSEDADAVTDTTYLTEHM